MFLLVIVGLTLLSLYYLCLGIFIFVRLFLSMLVVPTVLTRDNRSQRKKECDAARLDLWNEGIDRSIKRYHETFPEDNDYDENGVPYS